MKKMKKLILKRHENRRIKGGHLWIYSNEVNIEKSPLKSFHPGEQVRLEGAGGDVIGTAYVNPHSLICARLVSRVEQRLDYSLLLERFNDALSLRQQLFDQPYYRLVYGESDLLPGLIVDRFGPHLCVQINTAGMDAITQLIVDALKALLKPDSIFLRNDSPMRSIEGLPRDVQCVHGDTPAEVELIENGVRFLAPLQTGQKTGWFYDQRPNRHMLKNYVREKRVLDVFSYIGSFAVQAAAFGAKGIWAVDASRPALELAEKNAKLNGVDHIFTGAEGDAFHVLKALHEEEESFDVIVVDPPAFIKRKKDHQEGLRAYQRVNELAIRLLEPQGFLLTASCSMHLKRSELINVLRNCAAKTQRHVQILAEGLQGPDHPIHPSIPETKYLKAFLARVM